METIFLLSLFSSAVPSLITYIPTSPPSLSSLWPGSPKPTADTAAAAAAGATQPPSVRPKGGDSADTVDDLPALRAAARRAHTPSTFVEYARLSRRIAAVEAAAAAAAAPPPSSRGRGGERRMSVTSVGLLRLVCAVAVWGVARRRSGTGLTLDCGVVRPLGWLFAKAPGGGCVVGLGLWGVLCQTVCVRLVGWLLGGKRRA